ncbi:MAG: hypothetical protein Q7S66_04945 [bacterium]|nr:hypothetical protein [bacterium]
MIQTITKVATSTITWTKLAVATATVFLAGGAVALAVTPVNSLKGQIAVPAAPTESSPQAGQKNTSLNKVNAAGRIIIDCNSSTSIMAQTNIAVRSFFYNNCPKDKNIIAVYDIGTSLITTLGGALTSPKQQKKQDIVFNYLRDNVKLFGVSNPAVQLQLSITTSHFNQPLSVYKFVQVLNKIPVNKGSVSVTIDKNGVIRSVASNFKPDIYDSFANALKPANQKIIQSRKVDEVIAQDLKTAPIGSIDKNQINQQMLEKIKKLVPTLVYAKVNNQWALAYQQYAVVWEKFSEKSDAEHSLRLGSYMYLVDANNANILAKENMAQYCSDSVGQVYTPTQQTVWNDRQTVPFNTCKGWELAANLELHDTAYYLEDHTRSGVLETYDIESVADALVPTGYYSVALAGGWPLNTPTDGNDVWRDDVASESATVHWAAQKYRDFLMEQFGRDQIDGSSDIDIGAKSAGNNGASFAVPPINTIIVTDEATGLSTVAHELTHILTYSETPGTFTFMFDDRSVNEHISNLFAIFTLYKKSPYAAVFHNPWCTDIESGTAEKSPLKTLLDQSSSSVESLRIFNDFKKGVIVGSASSISIAAYHFCGRAQPFPRPACFHKIHESTVPDCMPGSGTIVGSDVGSASEKISDYARTGIPIRAEYLLTEGTNLYSRLRLMRLLPTNLISETTDEMNQIIIKPIGMENLMQITYQTVISALDAGMSYEDWAARQILSSFAISNDDTTHCNVKNAYAAVGYGESNDWDCDGVPNDADQCPGHYDSDTSWINKHPLFCGKQKRVCSPATPQPELAVSADFPGRRICDAMVQDPVHDPKIVMQLDPYADYKNVGFLLSCNLDNDLEKTVPCRVGDAYGDSSGRLYCDVSLCLPPNSIPDPSHHYMIGMTESSNLVACDFYFEYKSNFIKEMDAFSPSCPGDENQVHSLPPQPSIIDSFSDNLGNMTTSTHSKNGVLASNTQATVQPRFGDTLTFTVWAHDPNGLPITYHIDSVNNSKGGTSYASQDSNSFNIQVTANRHGGKTCFHAFVHNSDGQGNPALGGAPQDDIASLCYNIVR